MPSLRDAARNVRLFAKYHLVRRPVTHPAREEELGVELLELDPDEYARALAAHAPRADMAAVEHVHYRGRAHPIHEVRLGRAGRRLLILAGVHGNEHAGPLAIPAMLEHYAEHPEAVEGVEIRALTPVNPVGAAERSRYNAHGFDINRDFIRFETPEARLVRDTIERARPDFVLSLHEGPQADAFLFANSLVRRSVADAVLARMRTEGVRLATKDYFGRRLRPPGYAPATRAGDALHALWGRALGMATSSGYSQRLGIPEITLETSWRDASGPTRIAGHVAVIRAVVEQLARG